VHGRIAAHSEFGLQCHGLLGEGLGIPIGDQRQHTIALGIGREQIGGAFADAPRTAENGHGLHAERQDIKVFWFFFSKKNSTSFLKKRSKKLLFLKVFMVPPSITWRAA
jgi:ribosomal protein L24E